MKGNEFTPDNPSPVAIECVTCTRMTTTGTCAECALRKEQESGKSGKRAITLTLGPLAHEWIEQEARRRRTSRSEVVRTLVQKARLGLTPALGGGVDRPRDPRTVPPRVVPVHTDPHQPDPHDARAAELLPEMFAIPHRTQLRALVAAELRRAAAEGEARGEREAAMRTPPAHTSVESPEAFVRGLWTGKAARGQNAEMVHERDAKVRAEGDAAGYARGVEEAAATRNLSDPLSMDGRRIACLADEIHGIKAVPRG